MAEPKLELLTPHDANSEAILLALRRISRRVSLHSKKLARQSGLTLPQVVCLRVLAKHDPPGLTGAAIGRAMRLSSPTVTGILDRLERGGYVERVRDTVDRRRVHVSLTQAGHERVRALPSALDGAFLVRFGALPAREQADLLRSLERIVALMEEESPSDADV